MFAASPSWTRTIAHEIMEFAAAEAERTEKLHLRPTIVHGNVVVLRVVVPTVVVAVWETTISSLSIGREADGLIAPIARFFRRLLEVLINHSHRECPKPPAQSSGRPALRPGTYRNHRVIQAIDRNKNTNIPHNLFRTL